MKSESETCVMIDDKVQVCLKSKDLNFVEKAAWSVFRWTIDVLFPCMETRHGNQALWQGNAAARANADCAKRAHQLQTISAEIESLSAQNEKLADEERELIDMVMELDDRLRLQKARHGEICSRLSMRREAARRNGHRRDVLKRELSVCRHLERGSTGKIRSSGCIRISDNKMI